MAKPEQIIRKAAKILGATVLTSVAALSAANAATTSQTGSFYMTCSGSGDLSDPCLATDFLTFDQFDPAGGTLTDVTLSIESEVFAGLGAADASVRFQMTEVLSGPNGFLGEFNDTTSLAGFGLGTFVGTGVDTLTFGLDLDAGTAFFAEWRGVGFDNPGRLTLTYEFDEPTTNVVPLPASAGFLAVGLLGLGWAARRKS